jgi:tetratricopeptide (TPR) repeat protein
MRIFYYVAALVIGCGGRVNGTQHRTAVVAQRPAADLARAKNSAASGDPSTGTDPRVVDLDIIRITASAKGVGGEATAEHVATADLFKQANELAKAKSTERALGLYRQIIADFPDSKFAPVSLFNVAAIFDARGDFEATIATLADLVRRYPDSRESIDGHLYIAALQAEHRRWTDAISTLDNILARANLTYSDRIEALARQGYVWIELNRNSDAKLALDSAVAEWRKAPHVDDPYYIAMATYYRGELAHRAFRDAPVRLPDDVLIADLERKRVLAVQAYDQWKESLGFRQAYWATASGYQMSQIFVELWAATVTAPFPARIERDVRDTYAVEVHDRVREHLAKALEGHRMNVELAKAYGVQTEWSVASAKQAEVVADWLANDRPGSFVTPDRRDGL